MKSSLKNILPVSIRVSVFIFFICFTQFSNGQSDRQKRLSSAFEKCYQSNVKTLLKKDIWVPKEKRSNGKKMNELYEQFLIEKNLLDSIDKESYTALLGNTKKGISNEFSDKMGFNTEGFFPSWTVLRCHDELYRNHTLSDSDWQFKFATQISSFQASGALKHLKNAIEIIPDKEFSKMHYRHDLLNLIYILNYKMY